MAAFSDRESTLLITIYGQPEIQARFKDNKKGHQNVWKDIAVQLQTLGEVPFTIPRSAQQCKDRVGNLKKKYYSIKRELRSGDPTPTWVFWNEMNLIFGCRPTAVSQVLFDSLELEMLRSSPRPTSTNIETGPEDSSLEERSKNGLKRAFTPMPNSARRAKLRKQDEHTQMLDVLKKMQETEDKFLKKQETTDATFLNLMGSVSRALTKLAHNPTSSINVGKLDDNPTSSINVGKLEDNPTSSINTSKLADNHTSSSNVCNEGNEASGESTSSNVCNEDNEASGESTDYVYYYLKDENEHGQAFLPN